ncbi:IclR family transcriptional regulator [Nocardioides szechwanensis]|uniref:Transcriptional regulator, IclR family n=1 Tax=Nocardioides szechwanensis TaxID=1005944 RepID=A0A1H0H097_9ACTN|nr:IclR family transcriptional regulator [Nocardioides szechwanensis]GEP34130.1 IclR family transcriptional regulator [Nocardioides szechwanensis]SDO12555.1 transcriptional regulator, IclR family [Nocardioides szechwanensis]
MLPPPGRPLRDAPTGRRNSSGLSRDVEILDLLSGPEAAHQDGLRVLQIAEALGRDKATISRALATLADAGLVDRDADRLTYRLGSRLYALAARTSEASMVQRARPILRQIAATTRETTHLCVLRGGNVLTLASELSSHVVGTTSWAGTTTAAWRTPSGRVLISDWDRASVETWYKMHGHDAALVHPQESPAPGAFSLLTEPMLDQVVVQDLETLHSELGRIRRRGFATSEAELEAGVVAASAPVRDATGAVVAALNVSAPKARLGTRLEDLGIYVTRCAAALSTELGAPPRRVAD